MEYPGFPECWGDHGAPSTPLARMLQGLRARVGGMARDVKANPVVLSRIYTRTGDDGSTALADGTRVAKSDSRLAAYADADEANAAIGVAITLGELDERIAAVLRRVQ